MGYTNSKGEYFPNYIDNPEDEYNNGWTVLGSVLTPEQLAECEKMSVKDCVAYKEKIMDERSKERMKNGITVKTPPPIL